jgi:hypothetical protein
LINEWWSENPEERYWIEITDRPDIGANLLSPKLAGSGRETPGYSLVSKVRAGDVIFHYSKSAGNESGIVAVSIASGPAFNSQITWSAHGSYSKGERTTAAYEVPLKDLRWLERPISLEELRLVEDKLKALRDDYRAECDGALYYPWAFSDKRPMRTAQSYLAKFPAGALSILPQRLREEISQTAIVAETPPTGHWLFQANPKSDIWDGEFEQWQQQLKSGSTGWWYAVQHRKDMKPRDLVVFWESGKKKPGAFAFGHLTTEPVQEDRDWVVPYIIDSVPADVVPREVALQTQSLQDMALFRQPQASNFPLTKAEWEDLNRLAFTTAERPRFDSLKHSEQEVINLPGDLDQVSPTLRRTEQGILRKVLFGTDKECACSLCGNWLPVDLLIAAHIKKRSKCSDRERRDISNVVMSACVFGCDSLYEKGYIRVNKHGRIEVRKSISSEVQRTVGLLNGKLCLAFTADSAKYFAWHSENVFRSQ